MTPMTLMPILEVVRAASSAHSPNEAAKFVKLTIQVRYVIRGLSR
jgi:hypothetical protein